MSDGRDRIELNDLVIRYGAAVAVNGVSFDLADLGRHNILEHDISLRYVMRSSSSNLY